jgi:DNA-binding transcriptional regulator WhiA
MNIRHFFNFKIINLDKSLGEIAMLFKNKFGKTISKEYISKLSKS